MGASAMAQITIPASDFAHKILPRTLVHLFFFENKYELGAVSVQGENGTITNQIPLKPDDRQNNKNSGKAAKLHNNTDPMNWKLLFTGEVVGYSFTKIGGIRNIKLSCIDFTSYWSMAQMYWGAHSTKYNTFKRAIFVGATRLNYGGKTKVTTRDTLVKILTAKPNGRLQPEGILGGLVSLLESATGVFAPGEGGKAHRGVNDMLSYAELKYHLTRTIGAVESDRTASIFMNSKLFKQWLSNVGVSVKQTATYIQLVQAVLDQVYYQWNAVIAPPYMAGAQKLATTKIETIPTRYKYGSDVSELVKRCTKSHAAIGAMLTSTAWDPNWIKELDYGYDRAVYAPGVAAADDVDIVKLSNDSNISLDDTQTSSTPVQKFNMKCHDLAKNGGTLTQSGHIASWNSTKTDLAWLTKKGRRVHDDIVSKSKGNTRINRKAALILEAFTKAGEAVELMKDLRPNHKHKNRTVTAWEDIRRLLEMAAELAGGKVRKPTRVVAGEDMQANTRLIMSLFKPDLYMCPPPKCNVLFPDMLQHITFSRNWMSEVSRLWLSTTYNSGKDRQDIYFAPNTNILGTEKSSAEKAVKDGISFHMKHERFAGIIPKFFKASNHMTLKKAYQQQISEEPSAKLDGFKNAHLVKTAQFMFFKFRFGGRVMQLTCRYSPQLVVGLPCLVLDPKEGSSSRFKFDTTGREDTPKKYKTEEDFTTGTHYFGVVSSLQHVMDSSGGVQTRVVLTDCRTHTEASEIFGGGDDLSSWVYKSYTAKDIVKGSHKAEITGGAGNHDFIDTNPETILGTRYNPKAKYVVDVKLDAKGETTYTHFDAGYESSTGYSAKDHPRQDLNTEEVYNTNTNLIPDLPLPDFALPDGSDVGLRGSLTYVKRVPATNVNVYELTRKSSSKKVDFTFEGIVTPPWYSSCFLPNNIGEEYYLKLVGCKSVVDDPAIQLNAAAKALNDRATDEVEEGMTDFIEIYGGYKKYDEESYETEEGNILVPKSLVSKAKSATYAAEYLAETWMGLKEMDSDINRYIDTYVDRSYATMIDIFGSNNEQLQTYSRSLESLDFQKYKVSGIKGFHHNAFGNLEGLENLKGALERLPKADTTSTVRKSVSPDIDTRSEKYKAVLLYRNSLQNTPTQE